ncbi:MAG: hypothetical protein ACOH18_01805 [Candidatus Saccharimonadaceae bacterium]
MDTSTAISLLTINLILLSVVIISLIVMAIVLIVKLNKIASNVEQTTSNITSISAWFSPFKVFSELAKAIKSARK